ncbi:hypothetical protein CS063_00110 [Sporanaerobium hydrogeniformans]|uniref:Uncharacterized protein n=1 Tax=Sporanaerobium hydrogeniformans TaxID=3072179 RepID=A0AC61DGE7_9FIRM|nr:hypothetical protein [Sporanaerobium hydrogeniformans]PHV71920.1 hypothetical protein CS063_00110 [Sporanaerobium hydrogeniformans]
METAVLVTILGLILTIINIADRLFNAKERVKAIGAKDAVTEVDISTIKQGNATILVQLEKMDTKMDNYQERLVRVEESAKQAHKRIDGIEGRL